MLSLTAPEQLVPPVEIGWRRPVRPVPAGTRAVPGHNRWHPDIPAVAEVISGGSVRLSCEAAEPGAEPLLCGPISVVGAEPGDIVVVDVLNIGRLDGRYSAAGHPGVLGCAPGVLDQIVEPDPEGVLLGLVRPVLYRTVAQRALRTADRAGAVGGCADGRLAVGYRLLLPVETLGAKLSVGDPHFTAGPDGECVRAAGWIDLRINLTKRGVERFGVTGPLLVPDPGRAA